MSKITKFTPGPWVIDPEYPSDIQSGDGSFEIARALDDSMYDKTAVYRESMPPFEEAEANAALIAAAPDLYRALENARPSLLYNVRICATLSKAAGFSESERAGFQAAKQKTEAALRTVDEALAAARGETTQP